MKLVVVKTEADGIVSPCWPGGTVPISLAEESQVGMWGRNGAMYFVQWGGEVELKLVLDEEENYKNQ